LAAKGVFVTVVVVSPAQRPSHGQLEPSRHRPPHLVWRSGPTQPGHPQIVCGALESRALVEKRAEIGRRATRGADPPPLRWILAYEGSRVEGVDFTLADQVEGEKSEAKHVNELLGRSRALGPP
jgi:hypothetical protein